MSSDEYCDLEPDLKITTPIRARKKSFANVHTNTDPFTYSCKCKWKDESKEVENHRMDLEEYVKSLNYINSMHELINEYINTNRGSNSSGNFQFRMPNFPNFLKVFDNLKKCETKSPTTTTSSLMDVYEEVNETTNIKQKDTFNFTRNKRNTDDRDVYLSYDSDRGDVDNRFRLKQSKLPDRNTDTRKFMGKNKLPRSNKKNKTDVIQHATAKVDTHWKASALMRSYNSIEKVNSKKNPKSEDNKWANLINSFSLSDDEMDEFALQLVADSKRSLKAFPLDNLDNEINNNSQKFFDNKRFSHNQLNSRLVTLKTSPSTKLKPDFRNNQKKSATASVHTRPRISENVSASISSPKISSFKNDDRVIRLPSISDFNKSKMAVRRDNTESYPNSGRKIISRTKLNASETEFDIFNLDGECTETYFDGLLKTRNNGIVVPEESNSEKERMDLNSGVEGRETFSKCFDTGSNSSDGSSDVKSDKEVTICDTKIPVSPNSNLLYQRRKNC